MDQYGAGTLTMGTTKAGMSAGTTTTLTTANTQLGMLRGKAISAAAAANQATPTLDSVTGVAFVGCPINKGTVYTMCRDSAGTLRAVQGQIVDLDSSSAFIYAPQFGPQLDTLFPIGYILVKVGPTGATWTLGTSNLAGPPTGVVFTIVDASVLPDRPQVS